ncbi:MAG: restriction endonuclease subunit S [Candidatus Saccharimonadales bacterium]
MIDELPHGWASVSLGELGAYFNGRAFKPSEWEQHGLPIIRIQNLNDPSAPFNYSRKKFDERVRVKNGDLLIAWSASLGAFIWNGGDAWLNQHIFRVEHNTSVCTKHFLYYSVRHALDDLYLKAHGSGMVHVTKPVFEAQQVPLPPIPEQQRIVAKLEQLLGKVDDCRKRVSRVPAFLARFRQSILVAACSGRLTADWRIQREGAPATGETDAESDDLPPGWRTVCVGDVIEDLKYGTSQRCGYEKRGVPVLRIPNVTNGVIDHGDLKFAELPAKEQKQLYLLPGDILIVRSNGSVSLVGKCALITEKEQGFSYAGYLIRIRPNKSLVSPDFLRLTFSSYDIRLQIELEARSTSGVNNINSEEVRALHLSLPPLKEQEEIVRRVNGLFALADKIETRYKTVQQQVDRLPQSILAKAFRGELVPTEAELAEREGRSYESAEQLLQRIQSSRDAAPAFKKRGKRSTHR